MNEQTSSGFAILSIRHILARFKQAEYIALLGVIDCCDTIRTLLNVTDETGCSL